MLEATMSAKALALHVLDHGWRAHRPQDLLCCTMTLLVNE